MRIARELGEDNYMDTFIRQRDDDTVHSNVCQRQNICGKDKIGVPVFQIIASLIG